MKTRLILLVLFGLLLVPAAAFGQDVVVGPGDPTPVSDGPATNAVNLYLVVLGGIAPLVGYLLNHFITPGQAQLKAVIQAVVAAGIAVLYQAVSGSDLGLNDETLLAAVTAMVSALLAHFGYVAGNINTLFGGGSNVNGAPDRVALGLAGNKPAQPEAPA